MPYLKKSASAVSSLEKRAKKVTADTLDEFMAEIADAIRSVQVERGAVMEVLGDESEKLSRRLADLRMEVLDSVEAAANKNTSA